MSLMLLEWTAWITDPAPRKSNALKNAWVKRWKKAALRPAGPSDIDATMYASWDKVEYASTRLMSSWMSAMNAAPSIVIAPMMPTTWSTQASALMKIVYSRPTRYTPAATMVAAWISAETGVGPAMASGSHT